MNMFKIFENEQSVATYLKRTWSAHGEIVRYVRKDMKAAKHLGDYDEAVIVRYACQEHRRVRVNKNCIASL